MTNGIPAGLDKKSFLKQLQQCADTHLSDELGELWQRRQELKRDLKRQEQSQKSLSKQIGPAKKNGEDVSALMQQMQALSAENKALKAQQAELDQSLYSAYEAGCEVEEQLVDELILRSIDLAKLELTTEVKRDDWQQFVERHPQSSLYHDYALLALLERQFGHRAYRFAAYYDGELVGILPMLRQASRLFGDFASSVPFFNYGGALEVCVGVKRALMEYASSELLADGVSYCEFRDDEAMEGWQQKTDKVIMELDLPDSVAALDKQLGTKLRAQIKRPLRENPDVKIGSAELLDDFYRVFAENMRDLGTPVYQKTFFADILNSYPQARLIVVFLAGKPVSCGFLLPYKDRLEIPWASTLRCANKYSMNMLLYWQVLCFAIENHYKVFDFGRSSKDAGTYKFKAQWGAKERPCYWHYALPNGEELPQLNPNNPKYKLLINIWQRLPVALVNLIGPFIVKNLP